ncbi:hypothetical protein LR48_Vigan07g026500 [Vigna angularis]|uniref:Uncharacterized protein n=1 Tax=Phaseolus angularis TaxID=3914 RepID=A0A0L9UV15_PHAAN|nr:hypothetical protein LR48_Vigan07g026500 [Vigna angularis]
MRLSILSARNSDEGSSPCAHTAAPTKPTTAKRPSAWSMTSPATPSATRIAAGRGVRSSLLPPFHAIEEKLFQSDTGLRLGTSSHRRQRSGPSHPPIRREFSSFSIEHRQCHETRPRSPPVTEPRTPPLRQRAKPYRRRS